MNSGYWTLDNGHWSLQAGHQKLPELGHRSWTSEGGHQKSDIRRSILDIRHRTLNIEHWTSLIRNIEWTREGFDAVLQRETSLPVQLRVRLVRTYSTIQRTQISRRMTPSSNTSTCHYRFATLLVVGSPKGHQDTSSDREELHCYSTYIRVRVRMASISGTSDDIPSLLC